MDEASGLLLESALNESDRSDLVNDYGNIRKITSQEETKRNSPSRRHTGELQLGNGRNVNSHFNIENNQVEMMIQDNFNQSKNHLKSEYEMPLDN